jgi:serine/threonine-protein kinase
MPDRSDSKPGSDGHHRADRREVPEGADEVARMRQVDRLCDAYEAALRAGEQPEVDHYLAGLPAADRSIARRELERVASAYAQEKEKVSGPRMLVLEVVSAAAVRGRHEFRDPATIVVGSSSDAHLPLDHDPSVSRMHCCLIWAPPHCRILDLGSQAGTQVNGCTVRETTVRDGDLLGVGQTEIRVRLSGADHADESPVFSPAVRFEESAAPATTVAHVPGSTPSPSSLAMPAAVPGYELLRELGRGGMGVVYEARHKASGDRAAVKVIVPPREAGNRAVQLFLREASTLSKLRHKRIVRFREIGLAAGQLFLATEFIPTIDLESELAGRRAPDAARICCGVICHVLEALEYAHGLGFVHRDIKPANILVYLEGGKLHTKLADFGLAKHFKHAGFSDLTRSGELRGTFAFMPPEQLADPRSAKPACDIFSAGVSLYYLLAGQGPYDFSDDRSKLKAIQTNQTVPLSDRRQDLPPGLSDAIMRALAKSPRGRYRTAAEMRAALLPYTRKQGIEPEPPPAKPARAAPPIRRAVSQVLGIYHRWRHPREANQQP